jgi:UDP-N-acetylmuramoyl-L-alanyl-D-glutamate--2,6-diaminopimelate ligase
MRLRTLLKALPFFTIQGDGNPDISNLANHHKKVKYGDLFICIRGLDIDSHTLVKEAEEKGAVAIISEKPLDDVKIPVVVVPDTKRAMAILADYFYEQPSHQLLLVGVTGTNGKTTTTHLIENIFSCYGKKTGSIGTLHIKMGDELEPSQNTTPDSLTLQQTFKRFIGKDINAAVMEVSSHALDQGRVNGCDYNIAVFTNLSQDHLDYHETMEEYRSAKSLLFAGLGNIYSKKSPKYAVINLDDSNAHYFIRSTAAHVLTYGLSSEAHFHAKDLVLTAGESSFTLVTPFGEKSVSIKLAGKFNVYNALAAITTAYAAGIPLEKSIEYLQEIQGVRGRFETIGEGQNFSVIVDYAHTPDGLQNVLQTIRSISTGNIFVVVGCGGDRDKLKRPIMAKIACQYGDYAIFTSDNPRTENPSSILTDMEAGVVGEKYELIEDRKEAIHQALRKAGKGDVVLIAGKGHETYQIIGNNILEFDDSAVARQILKEL